MGLFNFRDFITDLSIPMMDMDDKYVLILGRSLMPEKSAQNVIDINIIVRPISFPFIGQYDDYGRFVLDTEDYRIQNKFALDYLKTIDIELEDESVLDNHTLEERGILLMATSLDIYHGAIYKSGMPDIPYDYYYEDVSFTEHFANTLIEGAEAVKKYSDLLDATTNEPDNQPHLRYHAPQILNPDIRSQSFVTLEASHTITNYIEDKVTSKDITTHLLEWFCFYHFMEITGKMFKPIANLGGQQDSYEFTHLLKQLELEQAMKQHASYEDYYFAEDDDSDGFLNDLDRKLRPKATAFTKRVQNDK